MERTATSTTMLWGRVRVTRAGGIGPLARWCPAFVSTGGTLYVSHTGAWRAATDAEADTFQARRPESSGMGTVDDDARYLSGPALLDDALQDAYGVPPIRLVCQDDDCPVPGRTRDAVVNVTDHPEHGEWDYAFLLRCGHVHRDRVHEPD